MTLEFHAVPEGHGMMLDNTVTIYLTDNSDPHDSEADECLILLVGGAHPS